MVAIWVTAVLIAATAIPIQAMGRNQTPPRQERVKTPPQTPRIGNSTYRDEVYIGEKRTIRKARPTSLLNANSSEIISCFEFSIPEEERHEPEHIITKQNTSTPLIEMVETILISLRFDRLIFFEQDTVIQQILPAGALSLYASPLIKYLLRYEQPSQIIEEVFSKHFNAAQTLPLYKILCSTLSALAKQFLS